MRVDGPSVEVKGIGKLQIEPRDHGVMALLGQISVGDKGVTG